VEIMSCSPAKNSRCFPTPEAIAETASPARPTYRNLVVRYLD